MDIKTQEAGYPDNMQQQEGEGSSFDWRGLWDIVMLNWPWFAVSLVICLCGAFLYLRYKSPVYQVSVKMLIKDDKGNKRGGGSDMLANMQTMGLMTNSNGIDNEVEVLQSTLIAADAIRDLKLYAEYKRVERVKNRLIYGKQAVNVDIDPKSLERMDETMTPIDIVISPDGEAYNITGFTYDLHGDEQPFAARLDHLPASVRTKAGTLTFSKNLRRRILTEEDEEDMLKPKDIAVRIYPVKYLAMDYLKRTTVEPTSKTTSIALITLRDKSSKRAEDYLNQLAICYNRQANADKNEVAMKTEEFINGRLEKIDTELGNTEAALEQYKRDNDIMQLKLDATSTLEQSSQLSLQLSQASAQIELLDYLREYIGRKQNKYDIIPSNVGLEDQNSMALIKEYNTNVLDRNRLLRSLSEQASQVQTINETLDQLLKSINVALLQARRKADIAKQSIENQYKMYRAKITNTPEQERVLTQIGRQQEVKSGLYLMLLQKREENSISLSATADNGKLIDAPLFEGKVSPKAAIVGLVALVLGVGFPMLVFYLLRVMRYTVEGHDELAKMTSLPIVADVAVATESGNVGGIVVHENRNDLIDEIFRSMRTNIQFMLGEDKKVIMFTSSLSGEGKTFNAANLGVSFALLGKRVVLVGLDIRKPALGRLFKLSDREKGVTSILIKHDPTKADVQAQLTPSGVHPGLDLLLAGAIPPNPAELLSSKSLGQMIAHLKEEYDYVILDTAPVGLVTDTLQISRYADATVVVVRAEYTPKQSMANINRLAAEKKMPNTCIVLNGVDLSKRKYGYYYGYGKYGHYGKYGSTYGGIYGVYASSHYSNSGDTSVKR